MKTNKDNIKTKLNAKDIEILEILQNDARKSIREISKSTSLSYCNTRTRIQYLEKNKLINAYIARIDKKKIGLDFIAYIQINLKDKSLDARKNFEQMIYMQENIYEIILTTGNYEYLIKVLLFDFNHYHHFMQEKIVSIKNIKNFSSSLVLSEIKSTTQLPINHLIY